MNTKAQTFWLKNLKQANRYNSWIFSQILPYLGDRVLEIGCGNGNFTELLVQQCGSVMGVDLNEEYVRLAQKRLEQSDRVKIIAADATQFQGQKTFDTVVMLDVLEHIRDDVSLLQQLQDSLQPEGKLIVKVPALNWLYSPMDKAIGHYKRYDRQQLLNTFKQASFVPLSAWYFNLAGIPGWWLNGKVLKRVTPPAEQLDLFDRLVPWLSAIESKVKPPIGLSLFAIGMKKKK